MDSIQPNEVGLPQFSSRRKRELLDQFESSGGEQYRGGKFNAAYREDDRRFMRFLIPPGKRGLELGCGSGGLLAALEPSYGVGVDFSARTIAKAEALYPGLNFVLGDAEDPATLAGIKGPFDYIVIADTIGMFEDIDGTLRRVHHLCAPSTRIIISYYSHLWEPVLKLGEVLRLKSRQPKVNYIATADFLNLMDLTDFEMIRQEQRQLLPRRLFGLGPFVNRYISSDVRSGYFPTGNFPRAFSFPAATRRAISKTRSVACPNSGPPRRYCSSRATPATAPSRNANAFATPTRIAGISKC